MGQVHFYASSEGATIYNYGLVSTVASSVTESGGYNPANASFSVSSINVNTGTIVTAPVSLNTNNNFYIKFKEDGKAIETDAEYSNPHAGRGFGLMFSEDA